ncbi:hypothetical protein [Kitasatospora sp. NBC_01539]|uniref:hypothetical protein n=1 Tax=Kitasatospora sp. NBC_01539 TaxID=2903577 RepID=UPI0038600C3B
MNAYQLPPARHRGARHDPFGAALAWLWALGHLLVLTLLGVTAQHQLCADHLGPTLAADHEPDREALRDSAVETGT